MLSSSGAGGLVSVQSWLCRWRLWWNVRKSLNSTESLTCCLKTLSASLLIPGSIVVQLPDGMLDERRPWYGRFPKFHRVFVGPRPWHIEIRHRVKKTSTMNLLGFETLELKIRRLKLWKPTAYIYIYIYIYTYTYTCIYIYIYIYTLTTFDRCPVTRRHVTIIGSEILVALFLLVFSMAFVTHWFWNLGCFVFVGFLYGFRYPLVLKYWLFCFCWCSLWLSLPIGSEILVFMLFLVFSMVLAREKTMVQFARRLWLWMSGLANAREGGYNVLQESCIPAGC